MHGYLWVYRPQFSSLIKKEEKKAAGLKLNHVNSIISMNYPQFTGRSGAKTQEVIFLHLKLKIQVVYFFVDLQSVYDHLMDFF